jgi:hypothetical protein
MIYQWPMADDLSMADGRWPLCAIIDHQPSSLAIGHRTPTPQTRATP